MDRPFPPFASGRCFMPAVLRTLTLTTVLIGLVLMGYWRLSSDQKQQTINELSALNQQMENRLAQRQAMIDRLSRSRRVAHVKVTDQLQDQTGKVTTTDLLFIELDRDGAELGRQCFKLPGD